MRTTKYMGWRPDNPDYRDDAYRYSKALASEIRPAGNLPVRCDPQSKEVERHGVMDQGETGSCTGHGVGLVAAVERNVSRRSPYFIYYEARRIIGETDQDNGAYIRDAIKVTNGLGAPVYSKWPSSMDRLFTDPSDAADRDAAKRKCLSYHRLDNGDEYRNCLASGHLLTLGFTVYDNIGDPIAEKFGLVDMPAGNDVGGHCIAVIGFDLDFKHTPWAMTARDNGVPDSRIPARAYICQNSWGEGWGNGGLFAVPMDYFDNPDLADDAWTLRGLS